MRIRGVAPADHELEERTCTRFLWNSAAPPLSNRVDASEPATFLPSYTPPAIGEIESAQSRSDLTTSDHLVL